MENKQLLLVISGIVLLLLLMMIMLPPDKPPIVHTTVARFSEYKLWRKTGQDDFIEGSFKHDHHHSYEDCVAMARKSDTNAFAWSPYMAAYAKYSMTLRV